MIEVVGVQIGQHHPAFEVVLAFFELANDFRFGLGVSAEFHARDGAGVKRRHFFWPQHARRVPGHRPHQRRGSQSSGQPAAEPHQAQRGQRHHRRAGPAQAVKVRAQFTVQPPPFAPEHPAQRQRRPIGADDAKPAGDAHGKQ